MKKNTDVKMKTKKFISIEVKNTNLTSSKSLYLDDIVDNNNDVTNRPPQKRGIISY